MYFRFISHVLWLLLLQVYALKGVFFLMAQGQLGARLLMISSRSWVPNSDFEISLVLPTYILML